MAGKGHQVVTARGWCDIPADRIIAAPWNYKGEDERLSTQLRGNLLRSGQVESVIVRVHPTKRGHYEMVNGNHRLPEFKAAGIKTVHAFNLGKVTQEEAARVAIETNDTRFQNDPVKLAGLLDQLGKAYDHADLHATLPFTTSELDNYAAILTFDWSQYDKTGPAPATKPEVLSFTMDTALGELWKELRDRFPDDTPEQVLMRALRHAVEALT